MKTLQIHCSMYFPVSKPGKRQRRQEVRPDLPVFGQSDADTEGSGAAEPPRRKARHTDSTRPSRRTPTADFSSSESDSSAERKCHMLISDYLKLYRSRTMRMGLAYILVQDFEDWVRFLPLRDCISFILLSG